MSSSPRGSIVADVSFGADAHALLNRIRAGLDGVIRGLGADPGRPQEVSRRFGLNKNLTWKVAKIVGATGPEEVAAHLPGKQGCAILLRRLEAAGGDSEGIAATRGAVVAFDQLALRHAGDRGTFLLMLAARGAVRSQHEEASRKLAFQGNSATWGVQTRVQHSMHAVLPTARLPGRQDVLVVCGMRDLRRLRPDIAWPVGGFRLAGGDGSPADSADIVPLEPQEQPEEPPFMRRHCSSPLPSMRTREVDGARLYEVTGSAVGKTAAVSCVFGRVHRGMVPSVASTAVTTAEHTVNLFTPAELMVFDLLVHRSLEHARSTPSAGVFGQLPGVFGYPLGAASCELIGFETVAAMDQQELALAEMPSYRALLDEACAAADVAVADFSIHRLRLRFPPMPAIAVFRYDLPRSA